MRLKKDNGKDIVIVTEGEVIIKSYNSAFLLE